MRGDYAPRDDGGRPLLVPVEGEREVVLDRRRAGSGGGDRGGASVVRVGEQQCVHPVLLFPL